MVKYVFVYVESRRTHTTAKLGLPKGTFSLQMSVWFTFFKALLLLFKKIRNKF